MNVSARSSIFLMKAVRKELLMMSTESIVSLTYSTFALVAKVG